MRQIKASEVKPGMEVEIVTRMRVGLNILRIGPQQEMRDDSGHVARVDADTPVTVLSEPGPPQPEEPTELGVKARVRKGRFVRLHEGLAGSNVWFEEGTGYRWTWDDLCEMGPVTVVPDQGWTVPAETELTPEVPDRVDEWDTWEDVPEGVAVKNSTLWYYYRKVGGKIEALGPTTGGVWRETSLPPGDFPGTWTRVSDA